MNNKTIIAEKKDENTVLANNDITVLAKEPNDNETIIASDVTKLANNSLKENEIVNDDIVSGDVINGYKIGNIINENSRCLHEKSLRDMCQRIKWSRKEHLPFAVGLERYPPPYEYIQDTLCCPDILTLPPLRYDCVHPG